MDPWTVFPNPPITHQRPIAERFRALKVKAFWEACRYVHELPYGYNSDRDDLMILFSEHMGSCTTKHAVIATLAEELNLAIEKHIGIYAMTEDLVTGTQQILEAYDLPYVPMIHCFLVYDGYKVDLTEGNYNGKNRPVDDFLYTEPVLANISAKDEYLIYRRAVKETILTQPEIAHADIKTVLHAREQAITLLRANIGQ